MRAWAESGLVAAGSRVGEGGTGDGSSGWSGLRSGWDASPLAVTHYNPLRSSPGPEATWAEPMLLARAGTETGREGREIAQRDRREGVGGIRACLGWIGAGGRGSEVRAGLGWAGRVAVIVIGVEGGGESGGRAW